MRHFSVTEPRLLLLLPTLPMYHLDGAAYDGKSLEMEEYPLNPFSLQVMLKALLCWHHLSGCKSPVSVLKSPEIYPDTGTGQPWSWSCWLDGGGVFSPTAWSTGTHEAAGGGYSSPTAWVITKTRFSAGSSRRERGRAGKKERQSCWEKLIH